MDDNVKSENEPKLDLEPELGLIRLRVKKGINLAVRDALTSDPYIVITMGENIKLKTRTVNSNLNPEWNEEYTLSITDVNHPIVFNVFDSDLICRDDAMGDAEVDIRPYLRCLKLAAELEKLPDGCVVKRFQPGRDNCYSNESRCFWQGGNIVQDMILKLRNVETGEIVIQIEWIDIPGSDGLEAIEV